MMTLVWEGQRGRLVSDQSVLGLGLVGLVRLSPPTTELTSRRYPLFSCWSMLVLLSLLQRYYWECVCAAPFFHVLFVRFVLCCCRVLVLYRSWPSHFPPVLASASSRSLKDSRASSSSEGSQQTSPLLTSSLSDALLYCYKSMTMFLFNSMKPPHVYTFAGIPRKLNDFTMARCWV